MTLPLVRAFHPNPNIQYAPSLRLCASLWVCTMRSAAIYLSLTSVEFILFLSSFESRPDRSEQNVFFLHYANKMQVNGRRLPAPSLCARQTHFDNKTNAKTKRKKKEKKMKNGIQNPFFVVESCAVRAWCICHSATPSSSLGWKTLLFQFAFGAYARCVNASYEMDANKAIAGMAKNTLSTQRKRWN